MKTFLSLFFVPTLVFAECVHEFKAYGEQIQTMKTTNLFVEDQEGRFIKPNNLVGPKEYTVQITHSKMSQDYDDRFIKYYRYHRLQEFLKDHLKLFQDSGYDLSIVGQSIKKRDLYKLAPQKIDPNKKLILMFGRHHGDEGTANWIIEGFLEEAFRSQEFLKNFQLVLYPMVNPDGAEAKTRYNANRYDLNRKWSKNSRHTKDEIKFISQDLIKNYLSKLKPVIALDMHGSFTEDFIFRVKEDFKGQDFFHLQQAFIDELGSRDPYQNGNDKPSNGHPKMGRIVLIKDFGINALTHETIRDIPLNSTRSIETLKKQGVAVLESILKLY